MSDTRNPLIDYITARYAQEDSLLQQILEEQRLSKGPMMNIGPDQGKFLYTLTLLLKPKRILEIGSYFGYSSIWIGRAIKELNTNAELICVESSQQHSKIINKNLKKDGLDPFCSVLNSSGIEAMTKFIENKEFFDIIFIDADKANYTNYLKLSEQLLPRGGCLLVDNTLWSNKVLETNVDKQTKAIQDFNDELAKSTAFESILLTIQDGLTLAYRK